MNSSADTRRFLARCAEQSSRLGLALDPAVLARAGTDWRGRYHQPPLALLEPESTEAVAEAVRLASEHRVAIVPQGGNTGLCGGATPTQGRPQAVLSLRRLNRIRSLDPLGRILVAEAGVSLEAAQQAAASAGQLLALDIGSRGTATLGGLLSTNAGGTSVVAHGTMRAQCLGIEAVMADGRILHQLKTLRKDNTGYSLKDLLIGSEGTLGIITAASLALRPAPADQAAALIPVDSLHVALDLLHDLQHRLGPLLTGFEWMSAASLALLASVYPQQGSRWAASGRDWVLVDIDLPALAGLTSAEGLLADTLAASAAVQRLALIDETLVAAGRAREQIWAVRDHIPLASSEDGAQVKFDISLPLSRLADFVESAQASLVESAPGWRQIVFGHLGDGNLHFNLAPPARPELSRQDRRAEALALVEAEEPRLQERIYTLVAQHGGSLSAEHGLGQLRRDDASHWRDSTATQLMQSIRQTLDPLQTLNPDKFLPSASTAATAPRVAIVGAGLAGLACAEALTQAGARVTLWDKSRGVSGRLSTRRGEDWMADHGAPAFTAQSEAFQAEVERWIGGGVAAVWQARRGPGAGLPLQHLDDTRILYVGTPLMTSPANSLADRLRAAGTVIHLEQTITTVSQDAQGLWWIGSRHASGEDSSSGPYEGLVVAIPAPQAASLLAVGYPRAAEVAAQAQARALPFWTLMLVTERDPAPHLADLDTPGAQEGSSLGWMIRNSAKPGRASGPDAKTVWVLQASPAFNQAHLEATADIARGMLLEAFVQAGAQIDTAGLVSTTAHRWRYGTFQPAGPGAEMEGVSWLDQPGHRPLGLCGDWLAPPEGPFGVEAAWQSGRELGLKVAKCLDMPVNQAS